MMTNRDGRTLITGDDDGGVLFRRLPTGELPGEIDPELRGIGETFGSLADDRLVDFAARCKRAFPPVAAVSRSAATTGSSRRPQRDIG
jgi:hypothetical protein